MNRKTKKWIIMFSLLFVICCGVLFSYNFLSVHGTNASIYVDGELVKTIDLNSVVIPYEIVIEGYQGSNTLLVENGQISVIEADCPDHLCIKQGAIDSDIIPIVCLPNRLVISLEVD